MGGGEGCLPISCVQLFWRDRVGREGTLGKSALQLQMEKIESLLEGGGKEGWTLQRLFRKECAHTSRAERMDLGKVN